MPEKNNHVREDGCGSGSDGCNCGGMRGCGYGWCRGGRHHLMKIAIGLIVLAVTFWAGVKIGELKAYLSGAGYGGRYGMMRLYGNSDGGYGAGGAMMRGYFDNSASSTGQ